MSFVDCSCREDGQISRRKPYSLTASHIVTLLWLPKANILRGQTNNVSFVIDDTGSGAAGANVDSNLGTGMRSRSFDVGEGVAGTYIMVHMRIQFIVRICRLQEMHVSQWRQKLRLPTNVLRLGVYTYHLPRRLPIRLAVGEGIHDAASFGATRRW